MNPSVSSRRTAHTLVEVTIAILILGIIAAVSAPRMSSAYQAYKLESAAQQLAVLINHVRSSAINEGQLKSVIFDNDANAYRSGNVHFPDRNRSLIDVELPRDFAPGFELEANFDGGNVLAFDLEGFPLVSGVALRAGRVLVRSADAMYVIEVSPMGITNVTRPAGANTEEMGQPNSATGNSEGKTP